MDLKLPARIPVILTGNADSVHAWLGKIPFSLPLQRKSMVCQISNYLVDDAWRLNSSTNAAADDDIVPEVSAVMKEMLPFAVPGDGGASASSSSSSSFLRSMRSAVATVMGGLVFAGNLLPGPEPRQ